MVKKLILVPLLFLLLWAQPTQSQNDLSVILETNPPASQIGPDQTLTQTTLRVVDATGQSVPNAYLKLHLDAPPGNAFVSTDFPIVEGTPLLEYAGTLPNGVLTFDYIYPIRGSYSFQIEAGREASALTFQETLALTLSENRNEILNFVFFGAFLVGLGVVAGFVIGRGARAQRLAAAGLVLLFTLSLAGGAAFPVQAHGGSDGSETEPFTEQSANGDLSLSYSMNPGAGRVGTLSHLDLTLADSGGRLVPDTSFEIIFRHIEDEKPVFATHLFAPTGQAAFEFQFFDGAEHEVRIVATNPAGTVDLTRVIEVEGLDPPLPVKIKTTIYLVAFVLAGILIGLRLQVVRGKKLEIAPFGA